MRPARLSAIFKERILDEIYNYATAQNIKISNVLAIMQADDFYYVFTLAKVPLHKGSNVIAFNIRPTYTDKLTISHFSFVNQNNLNRTD